MIVGASLLGLALVLAIVGIVVVQTDWFRNMVRAKIVSTVETATGGRVEAGSFSFDWRHLRADVRDFAIHGTEAADAPPLFRAKLVEVELKLLSPFKGMVDIASLAVDTPQANVIVYADGHTNIPAPKLQQSSNKSGLQTIVDLAVGRFSIQNGSLALGEKKSDFSMRGENLRAQLAYNTLHPSYTGEVDLSPLHWKYAGNATLDVDMKLPVTLAADRISLSDARFSTPGSQVVVTGSMDHLAGPDAAPRTSAHIVARVALDEVQRMAGLTIPFDTAHGPQVVTADITGSMDSSHAAIQNARVDFGESGITASGTLQDATRPASMRFNSTLALGEIGRLLRVAARPAGTLRIAGEATMDAANNYRIAANVAGRNVAVGEGTARVAGVSVDSRLTADPHRIALDGLRLTALGGSFAGSGAVEEMAGFHLAGKLNHFDIEQMARAFASQSLGYGGLVSGDVQAAGNIKNTSDLMAHASLSITPAPHGVPVSGRVKADYSGRADSVTLSPSYLALPHSRVDLSGSLGQQIQVRLVTRDMSDFHPLAAIPVVFGAPGNPGSATVNATVAGKLSAPAITAQVDATNFSVDGRPFTHFGADVNATRSGASVANGVLSRGALQAQFSATVGLLNWKPENNQPLRADATVRNADLADILALAGQSAVAATGGLSADAHINGTVGDPRGNADLTVTNGTLQGEHFDSLAARAVMTDQSIDIPSLELAAGPSRVVANATYRHDSKNLMRGTLRAHVASNQVPLAQFQQLVKERPGLGGTVSLSGDATATVGTGGKGGPSGSGATEFQLISVAGSASARGLQMEGRSLGDFTATANTSGATIRYDVTSNFAGSTIRVNGQSMLTGDHKTTADAQIANLPIDRVLALAGRRDLPVSGAFNATAQVSGTLQDPHATANLNITNGSVYQEPFNRLQAAFTYSSQSIDVSQLRLDGGGGNIELSGSFAHPLNSLQDGQVRFRVHSSQLQLAQLRTLRQYKAGLAGTVELAADGAATLRPNSAPLFSTLNANLSAKGLSVDKKPVGDLTATAETRGKEVQFSLNSNFARSTIRGSGRMELSGDYPLSARLSFSSVTWSGLQSWIGGPPRPDFDASADGEVSVEGPATRTDALRGTLQLTRLEAHSVSPRSSAKPRIPFELHNDGAVAASLNGSTVTIRNAKIAGPYANLAITGTASMNDAINLRVDGKVKLEVLEAFDPDIFSSGSIALNATVTGAMAKPAINGRLQFQDASFNMIDVPNGLSNANGAVAFNGSDALIQNITGQSGGGKITLAGLVSYGGPETQFRVQATAEQVHVEYPQTITTEASARLTLAGTTQSSLLSGTVRILEVAMHSHSDMGSILTSAPPASSPANSAGLLAGMRFDVKIATSSNAQFRTSLAQNLQADANVTLRGSPDHPGMLGRIAVTQGDVLFFGAQYTINQGTVSFYNPQKIDPILDVTLETTVQGIQVSLGVSGSADKMKLSYSSDPPLQLTEIVSLLASGKAPSGDPVMAARQSPAPQQNISQQGASMLLGQAFASPVSGRLQRLFGVSKLKIDPQVTGGSNTPQATLTMQQQITRDVTFTYIQDVTQSNPTIIRMEWAINPRWSAIAARDVNGEFNVDLFYKRRFR